MNPYKTLKELCEAVNQNQEEVLNTLRIKDISFLPKFGGSEPDNTKAIWSWDEKQLMVGYSSPFHLIDRPTED